MSEDTDKGWLSRVSEILNSPLPGTADTTTSASQEAQLPNEDDDDETLLERITDILSKPLPGTDPAKPPMTADDAALPEAPQSQGEEAIKKAEAEKDADPISATGAAAADWMQRQFSHQPQPPGWGPGPGMLPPPPPPWWRGPR